MRIFGELRKQWVAALGQDALVAIEADLRKMAPEEVRFDIPGWFGG